MAGSSLSGFRFKWNKQGRTSQLFDRSSDYDVGLLDRRVHAAAKAAHISVIEITPEHAAIRKQFGLPASLAGHDINVKPYYQWDTAVGRRRGVKLVLSFDKNGGRVFGHLHGDVDTTENIRTAVKCILSVTGRPKSASRNFYNLSLIHI